MDKVTSYSYMFNNRKALTLDGVVMTNCNEATIAKITELLTD